MELRSTTGQWSTIEHHALVAERANLLGELTSLNGEPTAPRQRVFDEAEDPDNTEAAFLPSPSGFMLGDYPTDDVACQQHIPPHGKLLVCQTAGQFLYDGDGVLFERNPSPECGFGFDIIASADEILLFNIPEDARSSTLNTSHVLDRTGPWGCLEDAPGLTKYRRVRKGQTLMAAHT